MEILASIRKYCEQAHPRKGGEDHPLAAFMDVLGALVEDYEGSSVPELMGPSPVPGGFLNEIPSDDSLRGRDLDFGAGAW